MNHCWIYTEDFMSSIGHIRCSNCGKVIDIDVMYPVPEALVAEQKEHEVKCWVKDNPNKVAHLI